MWSHKRLISCVQDHLCYNEIQFIPSDAFETGEKTPPLWSWMGGGIYCMKGTEEKEQPQDKGESLYLKNMQKDNLSYFSQLSYFCDQLLCKCSILIVVEQASNEQYTQDIVVRG